MLFYLRYMNPIMAIAITSWCSFAAMKEDHDKPIEIYGIIGGGIPSYFFAKGVFCGLAIFLLGKILEELISARRMKK